MRHATFPRLLTGAAALLLGGAAEPPAERVIRPGDSATVSVNVNGQVRRMRIEPGAPGLILLAPEYATAAALKGGGMFGFGVMYAVGNERVVGRTAVARYALNGAKPAKRRIGWTPRSYAAGVDAVVGPAGLEEPVVRFVLGPMRPGERTVALPMARTPWPFGNWFGLRAQLTVGGDTLLVRFDPHHRRSVANALAAQRLAATLGGRFDGPASAQEIAFGIERPVRPMALARPLVVGPLSLNRLGARTVPDFTGGSTAAIGEAGDPEEVVDPADVVVTAKRQKRRPGTLTLGADQLDRCSSLVFDKPKREIRLTCE